MKMLRIVDLLYPYTTSTQKETPFREHTIKEIKSLIRFFEKLESKFFDSLLFL